MSIMVSFTFHFQQQPIKSLILCYRGYNLRHSMNVVNS